MAKPQWRTPADLARAERARDLVSRGEIDFYQALEMTVWPSAKIRAQEKKAPRATIHTRARRDS